MIKLVKMEVYELFIFFKFFLRKLLSKKVKHVIIYLRSKKVKGNLTIKYLFDGQRPTKNIKEIYNGY